MIDPTIGPSVVISECRLSRVLGLSVHQTRGVVVQGPCFSQPSGWFRPQGTGGVLDSHKRDSWLRTTRNQLKDDVAIIRFMYMQAHRWYRSCLSVPEMYPYSVQDEGKSGELVATLFILGPTEPWRSTPQGSLSEQSNHEDER
jgi:hypothetical protein